MQSWFKDETRYHLLFGCGMLSDDTEHACMVAQSLIEAGGEARVFERLLARRLRWWLVALPAGTGMATARAIIKLWLGFPPPRSGVFSAGNGPAMRAPLIGVAAAHDPGQLRALVRASTRITHTDPKAEHGAFAVALAAGLAATTRGAVSPAQYRDALWSALEGDDAHEFLELVDRAVTSVGQGESAQAFAEQLGLDRGVSGYMYHTVPVVLHAWLSHQRDLRGAVVDVIRCGGDCDSTAAIAGAIVGAGVGVSEIPHAWCTRLIDWPRTVHWMTVLAERLAAVSASGETARAPRLSASAIVLRNLFFLALALGHGARRLLPPY